MELHDRLAASTGNSWAAWRQITPRHNALVEAMLTSPAHVIATMRTKTAYAQVSENGKAQVKKLGLEPVQRDGMEYEFTVFLELSPDHVALATKDRIRLFDGQAFRPTVETGRRLAAWLAERAARGGGGIPPGRPTPGRRPPRREPRQRRRRPRPGKPRPRRRRRGRRRIREGWGRTGAPGAGRRRPRTLRRPSQTGRPSGARTRPCWPGRSSGES